MVIALHLSPRSTEVFGIPDRKLAVMENDLKGYPIHGTNTPSSIGRNTSHGCIRLRNRDVEQLFKMVAVGDQVELHGDRSPELARIFGAPALVATAGETSGQ